MRKTLALSSVLIGFGFLAGSIFNNFHLNHPKTIPTLVQELIAGFGMLWAHIGFYILVFVALHGTAGWLFAFAVEPLAARLGRNEREARQIVLFLFLIAVFWVMLESAGAFPWSLLGSTTREFLATTPGIWLGYTVAALTMIAVVTGLAFRAATTLARYRSQPVKPALALGIVVLAPFAWSWYSAPGTDLFPNDPERPHVILVGIDGWRLDAAPYTGGEPGLMPFVEAFANEAVRVEEGITPLARTFPAWWSIYTGQYPPTHGARYNLIADDAIRTGLTLVSQLGDRGYHSLFAMDERRFANYREEHGFDQVAGPSVGAGDFLLGTLSDSPLVNLTVNTGPGRYLFPFNHANRAAFVTYRPGTFDRLLEIELRRAPRQPLFLTAHYELPHWPFQWAYGPIGKYEPHPKGDMFGRYFETLEIVDAQVAALFRTLEELGVLDNAIVVLMSDHGEEFRSEGNIWRDLLTDRAIHVPGGHGTHVMGMSQHQVPILFRRYGGEPVHPRTIPGRASLVDIYPTLAEWLGLELAQDVDGISLYPLLYDAQSEIPTRSIPVENGFNTRSMMDGTLGQGNLFSEGYAFYQVDRSGRLELKPDVLEQLFSIKQRAVLRGTMILAALPVGSENRPPRMELADIRTRELLDYETKLAENEEVRIMRDDLCRIFAVDHAWLDCQP